MHNFTNDGLWSDLSCIGHSRLAVTALTKNACHIRTPWFTSWFLGTWKWISKIWEMGFVRNVLIYLTCEEISKKSYGLWYAGGSSRGYFLDLVLPVPKLPAVTVVFQLLQITSWEFSSSFPWDNFMYKYVINLIGRNRREHNVMM